MDLLIILLTILMSFAVFVGIVYLVSVIMFPRLRENVENYYSKIRRKGTMPGNMRNPYSFPKDRK